MTLRVCLDCMATIAAGRSRCATCERIRDKARGTRQERGYDAQHDRLRADYQSRMDRGEGFECWRCAATSTPHRVDTSDWQLGHCDDDRTKYHGPECPSGNQATSGRAACPHADHGADISPDA